MDLSHRKRLRGNSRSPSYTCSICGSVISPYSDEICVITDHEGSFIKMQHENCYLYHHDRLEVCQECGLVVNSPYNRERCLFYKYSYIHQSCLEFKIDSKCQDNLIKYNKNLK